MALERRRPAGTAAVTTHERAPAPEYVLRGHTSQINTVAFSPSRSLLYSGDSEGHVAAWSLQTFRPILFAKAHTASVLNVEEWLPDSLISHGRDNKVHVLPIPSDDRGEGGTSSVPSPKSPSQVQPLHTIEVNALGYCKCSVLKLPNAQALVAVPSTLKDELVDIFHFPSCRRVYRSIGKDVFDSKTGTVMGLGLYFSDSDTLQAAVTYEDGRFALFALKKAQGDWAEPLLEEGQGWQKIIEAKEHAQPTMSLALDISTNRAWTVAADHLVARYELAESDQPRSRGFKTPYPGRASIAVRDDGKVLAIAGWDGVVRLHSAKTFKPLAVLEHHRDSVYTVAFSSTKDGEISLDCKANASPGRAKRRRAWMAAAGKDERISLWEPYPMQ